MKRSILLFVVAALVAVVMGFSALSAAAQSGMDNDGGGWDHQSGYCNDWQKDWHQNDSGWWWYWWYRWCWSPQWDWYQEWDGWEWG